MSNSQRQTNAQQIDIAEASRPENEETAGGRQAFEFARGDELAVTLDRSGSSLPGEAWTFRRSFILGIRNPGIVGVSPEALLLGIESAGYYRWRTQGVARRTPTSQ